MTDQSGSTSEKLAFFERSADARKLVDSVVDYALYLLDLDGVVKSWNPGAQRIKGYRAEEIIGRDFSVFYTDDDVSAGEPARALRMARTTGRFEAEGWRVRKDGSRFWAAVVIDAVSDSAGAITGFAKITRDATGHLAERVAFNDQVAKCQIIFEAAPNGMLIVDETGIITLANARVDTIFGYPPGGLLGRSVDVLIPDVPGAGHAAKRESFAEESVLRAMADQRQLEGRRFDGSAISVEIMLNPVTTTSGRYVVASVIDVTGRNRAEEQLAITATELGEANRLMAIAEQMAKVGYWRLDLRTNEMYWSDEVYRIRGFARSHQPTLEAVVDAFEPSDRERIAHCIERAIAQGASYAFESRIVRPDGTVRDVVASGQAEAAPDGGNVELFGVLQDITERRDGEREREQLLERVSILTQTAQVGIWEWDLATNALVWDPVMAALYGIDNARFATTYAAWEAALHDDDRVRVVEELTLAATTGAAFDTEFRVIWPNGAVHNIRARALVMRDAAGAPKRMIGTNWDITEVRTLAAQLRHENQRLVQTLELWTVAKAIADGAKATAAEAKLVADGAKLAADAARTEADESRATADSANRAKSEFLARMSHELRTPMNGIIGFTTLVLESDLNPEQHRHLTHLHAAGKSLMAIINDILDFSKIEAGKLEIEQVALCPRDVVDGALAIIRSDALAKGLDVDLQVASDVPAWVIGDPTRLRQILLNLLTNALKFTAHGRISLRLRRDVSGDGRRLLFDVTDTGIGIALEKQHLLFQDFEQISTTTSRQYGGTGLGLAISQRLVQAMHGVIGVTSQPDAGSTFWFSALLAATEAPPVERRKVSRSVARRILVVDDNNINQIVVAALLRKDGHAVALASDGAQAVAAVEAGNFDLVLMDMLMPVLDGIDATRAIRKLGGAMSSIPIVALTANAMTDDVARCRDAGMNAHLSKPVDRDLLRNAITLWTKPVLVATTF